MKSVVPPNWSDFPAAVAAIERALGRVKAPSAIIGGLAVIARGVPRFTEDIDATVVAADLDLAGLLKALAKERVVPRIEDWRDLVERAQILLLEHRPTGIAVDLSLAWLPFEEEAIRAAQPVAFGRSTLRAVRAEDLVIYKLIANRPQDLTDVERLLLLWGEKMDLSRVRRVLAELAEHLEGPDRLETLEDLLASMPARKQATRTPKRRAPTRKPAGKSRRGRG